jgi:hypothetical protein
VSLVRLPQRQESRAWPEADMILAGAIVLILCKIDIVLLPGRRKQFRLYSVGASLRRDGMTQRESNRLMFTRSEVLALAAIIGVVGISGSASAKTQEHVTHVKHGGGQQSNETQHSDIPEWQMKFNKSGNESSPPPR